MAVTERQLAACASEPIHIPGAIQPHGVLLLLDAADLTVLQASENAEQHIGRSAAELLGQPVALVTGEQVAARLAEGIAAGQIAELSPLAIATPDGAPWDGVLHATPAGIVLELEPGAASGAASVEGLYQRVRRAITRLQRTRTLADLEQAIVEEVHRLTGMARVMLYRFDREWNGEVIAEVVEPGMDAYLGLWFPASDIPAQARALYEQNWVRLIARVDYVPARIIGGDAAVPLDLSGSTLRSVSPVHLEYLRNMQVGASMSISLMRGGRLWGLIACHHPEPRYVSYGVRTSCEFLGQTFSLQLAVAGDDALLQDEVRSTLHAAAIVDRATGAADWAEALVTGEPPLPELVGAGGAAVVVNGAVHLAGSTPAEADVLALRDWLQSAGHDLVSFDALADVYPAAASFGDTASGLLAAAISMAAGDYALWFRPELVRTVRWAGRPDKAVVQEPASGEGQQDGGVRLHPRRSFEAWSETVRGRSAPWHDADLRAADQLRARVRDIVMANAATIARLNERLQLSNDELDSFAWIVGHDLKEPLRGMVNSAHAIADGEMEHVETVIRLGARMHVMLDSLLDHARADKLELKREHIALEEVVAEVVDSLRARIAENDVVIDVAKPLPTVHADRVRLASVLQNLVANAIKYNDSAVKRVEIGGRRDGDTVTVHVRDNGIGIEPRHHDSIFELFRRLHPRDSYGGGAGAGLTITRKMVERHGGSIRVESEPGTGTTFYFTLKGAASPGDG